MSEKASLYKILVSGRSCHGSDLAWGLPTDDGRGGWRPGDWHAVEPPIVVCERGLHLTTDPTRWLAVGCAVYAAEGAGETDAVADKIACERARLLRPAPEAIPAWWAGVESFVRDEIGSASWFRPTGGPEPSWTVYPGRSWAAAARAAAWDAAAAAAAWDAAAAAAWDAAAAGWDAARAAGDAAEAAALCCVLRSVGGDLPIARRHRDHAEARWAVWRRGYAMLFDLDGALHVWDTRTEEARA